MSKAELTFDLLTSDDDLLQFADVLTDIKMSFYSEYPYLQDTNREFQLNGIRNLLSKDGCVLLLVRDGNEVVGAVGSIPLDQVDGDRTKFNKFLYQNDLDITEVAYGAWTLTKPEYRRSGINSTMGDMLNEYYRSRGIVGRLMINVVRPSNDPKSPPGFTKASEFFLSKRGYVKADIVPDLIEWIDVGDSEPTPKSFEYYVRWL